MPLYQFPTPEDRHRIHNLIQLYAQGQIIRNTMMRQIAAIIERYNVSRFPVQGYNVRILTYYGDLPKLQKAVARYATAKTEDHRDIRSCRSAGWCDRSDRRAGIPGNAGDTLEEVV